MKESYRAVFTLGLLLGATTLAGARIEQINIQSFAFNPNAVTISVGDSVRWTNLDAIQHTATSDSGPAAFNSGLLSQNQSYAFQFTVAGAYRYHCTPHPSMIGRITVAPNGVEGDNTVSSEATLSLAQNVPNPAGWRTTIAFELSRQGEASLAVYDLSGKNVATLAQGTLKAGRHVLSWDGRNAQGGRLPGGVYFYRLRAEGKSLTRRAVLIR